MGKLKNIEWKNIYYMLCYCVEELEYFEESDIDYEDVKGTHDLLAQLLIKSFEKVLAYGYIKRYTTDIITTDRPYGIIDVEKSYETGEYGQGRLICEVNKFNINNELNKIIKAAFNILLEINIKLNRPISDDLTAKLNWYRNLLNGVDNISITEERLAKISIKQIERWYRPVIAVSKLILKEYLAIDTDGETRLLELNDHTRLCRIWEKFVRHFLEVEYEREDNRFKVTRPVYKFRGKDRIFDMLIVNRDTNRGLIIDTKWYETGARSVQNDDQINTYCNLLKKDKKYLDVTGCLLYGYDKQSNMDNLPSEDDEDWTLVTYELNVMQDFDNIKQEIKGIVNTYIM